MEEIPSHLMEQIHALFIPTLLQWKETDRNFCPPHNAKTLASQRRRGFESSQRSVFTETLIKEEISL